MTNDTQLTMLRQLCQDQDWFYDVKTDQYGRYVVYATYMNGDVLRFVPDRTENGKQVLCHFTAHATASKDKFLQAPSRPLLPLADLPDKTAKSLIRKAKMLVEDPVELIDSAEQDQELEASVQELTDELDRLEGICGHSILESVFFELHDGRNAVTNLSAKYPEVRRGLEALYERYGFDTIHEELEGG